MSSQTNPAPSLDQYKTYIQDLQAIGTRYSAANTFYFGIVSGLIGLITLFKSPDTSEMGLWLQAAVSLFAILLCFVWMKAIDFYRRLFAAKFRVLKDMEQEGGLFPTYEKEYEYLTKDEKPWLLDKERFIPVILSLPFFVVIVISALRLHGHLDHVLKAITG